jgi:hypothetical protein
LFVCFLEKVYMERFRQVHRYAEAHQRVSGYPDFEQSLDMNGDLVYGTILLDLIGTERRVITANELGYSGDDVGQRSRAAHSYAESHGFVSGFPDWEQGLDASGDLVYGTILLRSNIAERRVIKARELGYTGEDIGQRSRSAHSYAESHGFVSGFPDWEQSLDASGDLVYGVILLKNTGAERRVILADILNIFTSFTFAQGITIQQQRTLLERHSFAISRINSCANLSAAERQNLRQTYRRPINHGINNNPGENASAIIGGTQIDVNFGVLFPQGATEIAQTLIHEMMHCAGFTHPNRQPTDTPFDGGLYYGTPPLQAEICIAGSQSDQLLVVGNKQRQENCVLIDGKYVITQP